MVLVVPLTQEDNSGMKRILGTVATLAMSLALTACSDSTPDGPTDTGVPPTDDSSETTAAEATTPPAEPTTSTGEDPGEPTTDAEETPSADCVFTPGGDDSESGNFDVAGETLLTGITQVSPDRIELTFDGDVPGWRAGYNDDPVTSGKGDPVEMEYPFVFELLMAGMGLPGEDWSLAVPNDNVQFDGPFEGQMSVFTSRPAEQAYCVVDTDGGLAIEFRAD